MKSIHVLRKPCSESTVAANVLRHGTGALNVDGSRVSTGDELRRTTGGWQTGDYVGGASNQVNTFNLHPEPFAGRWPANLVLGACLDSELDGVFPHTKSTPMKIKKAGQHGSGSSFSMVHYVDRVVNCPDDEGSAARYFKRVSE